MPRAVGFQAFRAVLAAEFLDYRVVEMAARLPSKLRLNGLTEKYLLKRMARGQVPAQVIDRPKQPYRAPISRYFMGANPPAYVAELLSDAALKEAGCFDPSKVQRLVAKCLQQEGRLVSAREHMALLAILSHRHHRSRESFSHLKRGYSFLPPPASRRVPQPKGRRSRRPRRT
jgi:asparagine synthase (glutamine-hydrolysing)